MLRVNVGLSKKLSKDYNSTGFSINLDGEITAPTSDPQAVIDQVKELFDLTEEALNQQIERTESTAAIGGRDEEPRQPVNDRRGPAPSGQRAASNNGNGRHDETATNKQIQYLLSISKRMRLTTVALEREIEQILGQPVGVYDLSKKQAAVVLDQLAAAAGNSRG